MTQSPPPLKQPPLPPPAQGGRIVVVDGEPVVLTGERALTYSVAPDPKTGKPAPLNAEQIAALKEAELSAQAESVRPEETTAPEGETP